MQSDHRGLARYAMALAGPVGSAAAQFALQLILLRLLDQAAFGRFSLLMILAQLSWGLCGALLCAPLPQFVSIERNAITAAPLRAVFQANMLSAVAALALFFAVALALGMSRIEALLYAAFAAFSLLRWFARSYAYAIGQPLRTTASDIVYSVAVLLGAGALWWTGTASLAGAGAVLLVAAVIGLLLFGRRLLSDQYRSPSLDELPAFGAIWHQHGRWALLGVATTEMTANAHAYFITLFVGPRAFAPIAASALLLRPMTVAMNSLNEFERARMARDIGDDRIDRVLDAIRLCRIALVGAWIAAGIAAAALLAINPRIMFPRDYDVTLLATGAVMWMLVAGVRMARTPDSALLQAAGAFRPLALASVWSSIISIALVLVLLAATSTVWSILGILLGEGVFAVLIWRRAQAWLAGRATVAAAVILPTAEEDPVLAAEAQALQCRS